MKKRPDTDWLLFFNRLAGNSPDPITSADWSRTGFQNRHRLVEDTLKGINKKAGYKLLDCGCGVGHYLEVARSLGAQAVGLDFSHNMLHPVQQKGFLCIRGRLEAIPFMDRSFDVVLSIGSLQYVNTAAECVEQMARVLSPKGTLILVTLSERSLAVRYRRFLGKEDKYVYTQKELTTAADNNGLTVMRTGYLFIFPPGFNCLAPIFNRYTLLNRIFRSFANAIYLVAEKKP